TINAFHQTALNYIGQNFGAKQYARVRKILGICLGYVCIAATVVGVLFYAFAPQLLSAYISDSPEAIAIGVYRMAYMCLPYFLCGLMDVTTGALRGIGASVSPMAISILGICGIRLAWIYTVFQIPQFHTPQCLYLSYHFSWTISFLIQILMFFILFRKYRKQIPRPENLNHT
ncbi:MAG: MATE family efflux transporter, partial [Clostridia bacterium]|nr:MATE family efflux transporter [Clostridia bacterium]